VQPGVVVTVHPSLEVTVQPGVVVTVHHIVVVTVRVGQEIHPVALPLTELETVGDGQQVAHSVVDTMLETAVAGTRETVADTTPETVQATIQEFVQVIIPETAADGTRQHVHRWVAQTV
jgi:hypothetical protein